MDDSSCIAPADVIHGLTAIMTAFVILDPAEACGGKGGAFLLLLYVVPE